MMSAATLFSRIAAKDIRPFESRQALYSSLLLLVLVALTYWSSYYVFPGRLTPDLNIYLVKPLLWLGVGAVAFVMLRRLADRPRSSSLLLTLAGVAGAFQVSTLLCAGLLFGFGHSPYARQAFHMAENIWYLSALIFGFEMSRAYLLAVWSRISALGAFLGVSLLYGALWIAPGQFEFLARGNHPLDRLSRTFMPTASESVMSTFLASIGGPFPAIIYRLSLELFRWLSPILPRLEWQIAGFVGTLAPLVAMLIVRDAFFQTTEAAGEPAAKAQKGMSPLVYLFATAVVGLIWLNTGMLGVKPDLVSGPSMEPYLRPGDVVITKDVNPATLKAGDVIKFNLGSRPVIHRITEVKRGGGSVTFLTQGDNNNTADAPVKPEQIEGKLVLKIPYAGWVPIEIKKLAGIN